MISDETRDQILELIDECLRLEHEAREAFVALEAARLESEVLAEWALEAGADPKAVLCRLSAETHEVLKEVALEFGFDLGLRERP